MKVKEIIEVDGIQVYICDSRHSIERFHERFGSELQRLISWHV